MMTADTVLEVCAAREDASAGVWLDGGWGVDALLGEQTRDHADLDLILDRADVAKLHEVLRAIGYHAKTGGTPSSFVFAGPAGHEIDLHPIVLAPDSFTTLRRCKRGCEALGDVFVADNGDSWDCGEERVERDIEAGICRLGGDVGVIWWLSDSVCSCHQARAVAYRCQAEGDSGGGS